ncbi:putative membrane protein [Halorubrum sp. AJ67]|nr:putative membrane protein [Halorubrum sp. AJ67]
MVALVALVFAAVPLGGLGALVGTTAGGVVLVAVLVCAVAATVALALPVRLVARTYLIAFEVSTLAGIDPGSAPLPPESAASEE